MTVWLDVDDLIRFFQIAKRPTGIQRFSFEVCAAAAAQAGGSPALGFCRRNDLGTRLIPVNFAALEARIRATSNQSDQSPPPLAAAPALALTTQPSRLFRLARRLPDAYRLPLGDLYRAGINGGRALKSLARAGLASGRPPPQPQPRPPAAATGFEPEPKPIKLQPGDWLINLGASWERPYSPAFLNHLAGIGARFALFAHDMIPDLFPEWCTLSMVRDFSLWLDETVPRADCMLALSHNTLADLKFSLERRGRIVPPGALLPAGGNGGAPTASLPRNLTCSSSAPSRRGKTTAACSASGAIW